MGRVVTGGEGIGGEEGEPGPVWAPLWSRPVWGQSPCRTLGPAESQRSPQQVSRAHSCRDHPLDPKVPPRRSAGLGTSRASASPLHVKRLLLASWFPVPRPHTCLCLTSQCRTQLRMPLPRDVHPAHTPPCLHAEGACFLRPSPGAPTPGARMPSAWPRVPHRSAPRHQRGANRTSTAAVQKLSFLLEESLGVLYL